MKRLLMIICLLLPVTANADVVPTNEWVSFWSDGSIVDLGFVEPGAVVRAYDPDGVQCGEFTVTTAGSYGLMAVYRDDFTTPGVDEGADPGDVISFTIDDVPATPIGPEAPIWSTNGDVKKVNLIVGEMFSLDIKPGSCPNPLNIKWMDGMGDGEEDVNAELIKGGVLPVAVVGNPVFDVNTIDVTTLMLEGVAPLRYGYEDVTTPVDNQEPCACTEDGPDGIMDLTLKFRKQQIVTAMGPVFDGETKSLRLTGQLLDGTPFESTDCVRIHGGLLDPPIPHMSGENRVVLRRPMPNPFNPVTRIKYVLPKEAFVRLSVYTVTGKLVEHLVTEVQPAGEYVVTWDAHAAPIGMYFCRIEAGGVSETRKLILLK
ncbi:MAG: T9SS type A sorting domain-containing protein [Candidatus Latescibacterota bacterium]|nr:MAG: T9SS type A sorting domain-containing protein [Candidatus Latescibacterota bacterium]